jgi:hypothetical protein
MRQLPKRDPLGHCRREAVAERRLGSQNVCIACGETYPFALESKTNPRLCTECRKEREGITRMEYQHIAGEANSDIIISIPANDHARLTEDQRDWPRQTLENPDGSPLLRAAGCIRGFADNIVYLVVEFLLWVAEMLEMLHDYLVEKFGPQWWCNTQFERFTPGRKKRRASSKPRHTADRNPGLSRA